MTVRCDKLRGVPVVILAGGLGKRLRVAWSDAPKCLAPVAGQPFLDYLLRRVSASGLADIVMCLGHRAEDIQQRYHDGSAWGVHIAYSVETQLMGTAGAIKQAEGLLTAPAFLVLNGDSFLDVDLDELLEFHWCRHALATLALAPARLDSRYGSVRVDDSGKVLGFFEKDSPGTVDDKRERTWINGGVYAFQKDLLSLIPRGRPVSLETEIFPQLVGQQFYGFATDGYFIDIGVPEDFAWAQKEFRERFTS